MPNEPISNLPAYGASTPHLTNDLLAIVNAGITKKINPDELFRKYAIVTLPAGVNTPIANNNPIANMMANLQAQINALGGASYIEFEGFVSQESTDAPTIVWLNPGSGRTISTVYSFTGNYLLVPDIPFDQSKTTFGITNNASNTNIQILMNFSGGNINIYTTLNGTDADDKLAVTPFYIRVYP